jgi:septum formation protein
MKLILGSQSPYRRKLLAELGAEFEVLVSDIDEKAIRCAEPEKLVTALARAKAEALIPKLDKDTLLITSDQVVVVDGRILEKPESAEEVREFLTRYNSYPAETVTAVYVVNLMSGKSMMEVDQAKVYFHLFTEEDIAAIISDGEVFQLAGGFAIEGLLWEKHIERIEGTRSSVIGLPLEVVRRLLFAMAQEYE